MENTLLQNLRDSEESYTNRTFWAIYPLFMQIQNGDEEGLRAGLNIQLDRFPAAGRISRDERKQLEYLTVSLVNTFMIAAIQGGVYPPEANWAADLALQRLTRIKQISEIPPLVSDTAFRFCRMVRSAKASDTGNPHVEKARQFLSTHLTQPIGLVDAAKAVGLSQYHLARLFKTHTGQTMLQYLTQARIEAAKQLLTTSDTSISELAAVLQFCDQSHFTRVFRRQTGITPAQFRSAEKR